MNPRKIKKNLHAKREAAEQLYADGLKRLEIPDYQRAALAFYAALKILAHPSYYYALAYTLKQTGSFGESLHCYQEALKSKHYQVDDHYFQAGLIATDAGLAPLAVKFYKKAFKAGRRDAIIYKCLGDAFMAMGRLAVADAYFYGALKRDPGMVEVKVSRAILKERRGDVEASFGDLAELVGTDPEIAGLAYANVCNSLGYQGLSIPILEKQLQTASPNVERRKLHFALGKQYDAIKMYREAFSRYAAGNALKKVIYRPEAQEHSVDETIRKFPHCPPTGLDISGVRAIFIVGMPRSGTTLVEQILSCHPDVYAGGEMKLLRDYRDSEQYLSELDRISNGERRVTNKNPYNFSCIGDIQKMLPGAHIIHCVRSPRDTMLSIFFQDFIGHHPYAYDLKNISHYMEQYERLMDHWCDIGTRILTVHYEDVVEDLECEARNLIEYVGLPWDEACLEPHKSKRIAHTASYAQVRKPIYTSSVGRRKNYEEYI